MKYLLEEENISAVFIIQSYFQVHKDVSLNCTHFFIMKTPNNREFQQITFNHSQDIGFKDFTNLYQKMYSKTKFFFSD